MRSSAQIADGHRLSVWMAKFRFQSPHVALRTVAVYRAGKIVYSAALWEEDAAIASSGVRVPTYRNRCNLDWHVKNAVQYGHVTLGCAKKEADRGMSRLGREEKRQRSLTDTSTKPCKHFCLWMITLLLLNEVHLWTWWGSIQECLLFQAAIRLFILLIMSKFSQVLTLGLKWLESYSFLLWNVSRSPHPSRLPSCRRLDFVFWYLGACLGRLSNPLQAVPQSHSGSLQTNPGRSGIPSTCSNCNHSRG